MKTEALTRRGFLLGLGAVAVATQALPLARAVEWVGADLASSADEGLTIVRFMGRIVRVAGSGLYGDGLIVAPPGGAIPSWVVTGGYYGHTIYPRTPVRQALEWFKQGDVERVYVPDFQRRRLEIRELALEDPEFAAVAEFAREHTRRIILS